MLNLLKYALLPPLFNVVLIVAGILLWRRMPWLGASLIGAGIASLLLLATPVVSHALRQGLENYSPPTVEQLEYAEAIVIVGGGRDYASPEFGWGDAPNNATWRRLAYGAKLARQTGLPILVSGGRGFDEPQAEATLMAKALEQVFDIPVRWVETASRTTAENASYTAQVLGTEHIHRIVLVSQAWHLPRAVPAFEAAGFDVIPAPTEFASAPPPGVVAWIPRAYHLRQSTQALHEWLGRAVYSLRRTSAAS
ncbi:YdcF family protein [Halomonas shantousis]